MNQQDLSVSDHLEELRHRLILSLGLFACIFIGGYFLSKPLLTWIIRHSILHHLVVIGVTEAFFGVIRVDFIVSLILESPLLLYQVGAFVFPGLNSTERKFATVFVVPGLILFMLGTAAGFFWFVPIVLRVMLSFTGPNLRPLWTLSNYLSFVIGLCVPFGIVAEFPLISGILSYYHLLNPHLFKRYRRYAIFLAFFASAILAPPDALSMTLMAIPIYLIYELSHLVSSLAYRAHQTSEPIL